MRKILMSLNRLYNYALYLYCFSVGIEALDIFNSGGTFSPSKAAGLMYLFIFLVVLITQRFIFISRKMLKAVFPILLVVLLIIINTFIFFDQLSETIFDTAMLLNASLFLILINHFQKDPNHLRIGFNFFCLGVLITAFFLIFGIGTEINKEGRITLFGNNHNELGFRFVAASAFILSRASFDVSGIFVKNFIILSVFLILVYATSLTASRSALGALVLLIAAYLFFLKSKGVMSAIGKLFLFFCLSGVLILATINSEASLARIQSSQSQNITDPNALGGRVLLWQNAYSTIKENWLIGVGISGYESLQKKELGYPTARDPHNVFLEVLLYTGIIGFLIFLIFIYKIFKLSVLINKKRNDAFPLIIFPVLICILFFNQAFGVKLFWLLSSYSLSLANFINYPQVRSLNIK